MRAEVFKELLIRHPFRPFRIFTSSGKTYDITHPDIVIVLRSRVVIGVGESADGIPDHLDHCALLHIERLEELSSASAGN